MTKSIQLHTSNPDELKTIKVGWVTHELVDEAAEKAGEIV